MEAGFGMIALWLALALAQQAEPADRGCTYATPIDIQHFDRCAWIDTAGRAHLTRYHLARLDYRRVGSATVNIDEKWYRFRRDGRSAPVMVMDNWAEDFSNGLSRSPVGGKIGFIDRSLKLVIPARYDGAFPFDHGYAMVCTGCTIRRDGAYSTWRGGIWGCIDRRGHELAPQVATAQMSDTCPRRRQRTSR
jgi:hypothetical protein